MKFVDNLLQRLNRAEVKPKNAQDILNTIVKDEQSDIILDFIWDFAHEVTENGRNRNDARVKGMNAGEYEINLLLQNYPTAESFWTQARRISDVLSQVGGMPLRRKVLSALTTLGEIIYQKEFEREIKKAAEIRERNALPQSKEYLEKSIYSGKVPDGFMDAGRQATVQKRDGQKGLFSFRETIVVDRVEDLQLQSILESAKEIHKAAGTDEEKVFAIAQLVRNKMNVSLPRETRQRREEWAFGKKIHLGEYNGADGYPGVCRHMALLVQTVLADLGYEVTLRRGTYSSLKITEAHSWNEIILKGEKYLLDVSRGRLTTENFEDFTENGGFVVPNPTSEKSLSITHSKYLDEKGKFLYSVFDDNLS